MYLAHHKTITRLLISSRKKCLDKANLLDNGSQKQQPSTLQLQRMLAHRNDRNENLSCVSNAKRFIGMKTRHPEKGTWRYSLYCFQMLP